MAENTYNNQGQLISTTPARMSPQYQVYALPGTNPNQQVFTVSDGFVPASQSTLSGSNQNFNLTAWMVGQSDPAHYGQLNLYEVPQGTIGPANADAEISANNAVSSEITLLNQHGSQVLLGETLMIPIGNSVVYLRPLYTAATTNPQPQLAYFVAVLGHNVGFEKTLTAALSDVLQTTVTVPSGKGTSHGHGARGGGQHPGAGPGRLQRRRSRRSRRTTSSTFQSEIQAMDQQSQQAQQVIGATTPSATTTTTTTKPPAAKGTTSKSKPKAERGAVGFDDEHQHVVVHAPRRRVPTSTEPRSGPTTTSTSLVSAAPPSG